MFKGLTFSKKIQENCYLKAAKHCLVTKIAVRIWTPPGKQWTRFCFNRNWNNSTVNGVTTRVEYLIKCIEIHLQEVIFISTD